MDMNKAGTVIVFGSRAYGTQIWSRAGDGTWSETKNWGNGFGGYGVAINGAGTRIVTGKETTGEIFEGNYVGGSWGSLTSVIDTSYTSWPAKIRMDSDGTTLIVNADPATEAGIYERQSGTSWTLSQSILSMASYYSRNGLSISYDGNMVLVGDSTNDTDGNNFGRAFLWNKSGGSWSLTKTFSNPKTSPAVNDYWGAGVAIAKNTKDRLIIGMSADSTAGTEYGSVYVHTNAIPDFISFDTYNKLSLSGITNPTSKLHALPTGAESTTTYDIGSATNIYIESAGTYTAEMKGSSAFALDSNVVGTIDQNGLTYTPGIQWSFNNTLAPTIDDTQIDYNTTSLVNASVSTNSALVTRHTMTTAGAASTQYATKGGHTALRIGSSYAHILPKAQHEEVLYGVDGSNMWKGSKNMFMGEWTVEIDVYFDGSVPTSTGTLLGYYISGSNEFIQVAGSRFVDGFWYTEGGSTPNQAEYHMDKDLSADTWYNVKIVNIPHGSGWKLRCYINDEFVEGYDAGLALIEGRDNVMMTRTFSKIYGLGGMRVGWGYGPRNIIDVLNRIRGPFNMSSPALAAAEAAVRDTAYFAKCRSENARWREWLSTALAELGVPSDTTTANFILARFGSEDEALACNEQLKSAGIIVRHPKNYGFPQCLRITVGDESACRRIVHAIGQFKGLRK